MILRQFVGSFQQQALIPLVHAWKIALDETAKHSNSKLHALLFLRRAVACWVRDDKLHAVHTLWHNFRHHKQFSSGLASLRHILGHWKKDEVVQAVVRWRQRIANYKLYASAWLAVRNVLEHWQQHLVAQAVANWKQERMCSILYVIGLARKQDLISHRVMLLSAWDRRAAAKWVRNAELRVVQAFAHNYRHHTYNNISNHV